MERVSGVRENKQHQRKQRGTELHKRKSRKTRIGNGEIELYPILRSFESEGKRYVYGYACIFDSPDVFGTVITKQLVEASLPHLRKFPAVRFMHKIPFGQIVFDQEVKGIRTFIDQHGFHVLAEIYPQFEQEWNMIRRGGWGFSYGLMPAKNGIAKICLAPNECYDAFAKGTLYEVSVVDAPAHSEATAHAIQRSIPRQNQICTHTSQFCFACANRNENEVCRGFQLLPNEKLEKYIQKPLDDPDRKSIERYVQMIRATNSPRIKRELSNVVLRFLKFPEKRFTMRGFDIYEIDPEGRLSIPDPPQPQSKIPDPEPECLVMLRANEKKRGEKKE